MLINLDQLTDKQLAPQIKNLLTNYASSRAIPKCHMSFFWKKNIVNNGEASAISCENRIIYIARWRELEHSFNGNYDHVFDNSSLADEHLKINLSRRCTFPKSISTAKFNYAYAKLEVNLSDWDTSYPPLLPIESTLNGTYSLGISIALIQFFTCLFSPIVSAVATPKYLSH